MRRPTTRIRRTPRSTRALAAGLVLGLGGLVLASDVGCSGGGGGSSSSGSGEFSEFAPFVGRYEGVIEGDDSGPLAFTVSFDGSGATAGTGTSSADARTFNLTGEVDGDGVLTAGSRIGTGIPQANRGMHAGLAEWTGTIDEFGRITGTWDNDGVGLPPSPTQPAPTWPPTSGTFRGSTAAYYRGSYMGDLCDIGDGDACLDGCMRDILDPDGNVIGVEMGSFIGDFAFSVDIMGDITGSGTSDSVGPFTLSGMVLHDGSCHLCPGGLEIDQNTGEFWTGTVTRDSTVVAPSPQIGTVFGTFMDGADEVSFCGDRLP